LYLAPPDPHTRKNLIECLRSAGMDHFEAEIGVVQVDYGEGDLARLAKNHLNNLNDAQLTGILSLALEKGVEPSVGSMVNLKPLQGLVALLQDAPLRRVLEQERYMSHFQPIVDAEHPAEVFGYECLFRGLDENGGTIPPGKLFRSAQLADMLFQLDRAARLSAIRGAAQHGIDKKVFINFQPSSIYDPVYCLKSTVQAADEVNIPHDTIVFEVVESEEVHDPNHLLDILRFYRTEGFQVALDDLGAGYGSLNLLHKLEPDFVKLDMDLVRDVNKNPFKASMCENMLNFVRDVGVKSIAEGIETVEEWHWLRDHGVDYMQGYLFAKPGSPPPDVTIPESVAG